MEMVLPKDKESEDKTKQFVCRLCGGTEYMGITNIVPFSPFGNSVKPTHYMCKQCSVLFKYPDLFSVGDYK